MCDRDENGANGDGGSQAGRRSSRPRAGDGTSVQVLLWATAKRSTARRRSIASSRIVTCSKSADQLSSAFRRQPAPLHAGGSGVPYPHRSDAGAHRTLPIVASITVLLLRFCKEHRAHAYRTSIDPVIASIKMCGDADCVRAQSGAQFPTTNLPVGFLRGRLLISSHCTVIAIPDLYCCALSTTSWPQEQKKRKLGQRAMSTATSTGESCAVHALERLGFNVMVPEVA